MSFMDVASSPLLYVGVFGALAVVTVFCALFYIKSRKRALALGIKKETLSKVVKSTLAFTIVPSFAIAVGLFALVGVVGVPWATLRLSIIGSLNYELNSANIAANAMGISNVAEAVNMGASVFGTIMFIMSLGIFIPPILNAFVSKGLATRLQVSDGSRKSFIPVMNACFMIALLSLYIPNYMFSGIVTIMVVVTSILVSMLFDKLSTLPKMGWMSEFAMPLSLLAGMVSSILWQNIFA